MFSIGGLTGIILGNGELDQILHDTYYVIGHFHFILSLGAIISIFSGIIFLHENIIIIKNIINSEVLNISIYNLLLIFISILFIFTFIHSLGFNIICRRIQDYQDYFYTLNFLSSIGSFISIISFIFYHYLSMALS